MKHLNTFNESMCDSDKDDISDLFQEIADEYSLTKVNGGDFNIANYAEIRNRYCVYRGEFAYKQGKTRPLVGRSPEIIGRSQKKDCIYLKIRFEENLIKESVLDLFRDRVIGVGYQLIERWYDRIGDLEVCYIIYN